MSSEEVYWICVVCGEKKRSPEEDPIIRVDGGDDPVCAACVYGLAREAIQEKVAGIAGCHCQLCRAAEEYGACVAARKVAEQKEAEALQAAEALITTRGREHCKRLDK